MMSEAVETALSTQKFPAFTNDPICTICVRNLISKQISEYKCRIFPEKLALAFLT